nr:cytochrome P450 4c21-like [Onthophagus taurus]
MFIAILVILLFFYLILRYRNYINKYNDINQIPGPTLIDIIKSYRNSDGLINFLQSLNSKYGPIIKIWIKPLPPTIITTDSEFLDKIYRSNDYFYNASFADVKSLFRNSLLTTTSRESWRNDKQIIMKTFTPGFISNHLLVYKRKYNEFIEMIYENLEKPIDIQPHMRKIHAEIMIESMMDPQIKMTQEEINEYMKNWLIYFDLLLKKMNSLGILYKFTNNYRTSLKCAENIIKIMENLLKRHKNVSQDQRAKNNLMYAFIDSGMSDDKIVDNMNITIGGGFETSVIPISLTLYELGKRPELQEKILEEILSVIGPELKEITFNDLNNMTYLQCVANEAVRLYFPSPFMDRLLPNNVKVKDMVIPKDTQVVFHLSKIFKSNEYFENANVFNPDRFLQGSVTEKTLLWFGYGAKQCPGKKIAYASIKLLLATILREFKIYPVKDHEVQLKSDINFTSVTGIPVIFKKRM